MSSYFHVHRNGYIESGDARIYDSNPMGGNNVFAHGVAAVLNAPLAQAVKLYGAIAIRDRLLVGLHLRSVLDTRLAIRGMVPAHTEGYNTRTNVTINEIVSLDALTAPITRVTFDRRLANAYGLDGGLVLNPDGSERTWFSS